MRHDGWYADIEPKHGYCAIVFNRAIMKIDEQSNSVLTVVGDIANALREQSVASNDIARRVEQMAQMTEENSASVRQSAAAA